MIALLYEAEKNEDSGTAYHKNNRESEEHSDRKPQVVVNELVL